MTEKKKLGRPELPESERRSAKLEIRLTVKEKRILGLAAGQEPVSDWARALLLNAAQTANKDRSVTS